MKALAWYTVIFNGLLIIALILAAVGVVPPAPFSLLEDIAWAVLTLPVLILGILLIRNHG
ncbi:hypothetical protein ACFLT4_03620 [Chloroflexota bacterium]